MNKYSYNKIMKCNIKFLQLQGVNEAAILTLTLDIDRLQVLTQSLFFLPVKYLLRPFGKIAIAQFSNNSYVIL